MGARWGPRGGHRGEVGTAVGRGGDHGGARWGPRWGEVGTTVGTAVGTAVGTTVGRGGDHRGARRPFHPGDDDAPPTTRVDGAASGSVKGSYSCSNLLRKRSSMRLVKRLRSFSGRAAGDDDSPSSSAGSAFPHGLAVMQCRIPIVVGRGVLFSVHCKFFVFTFNIRPSS